LRLATFNLENLTDQPRHGRFEDRLLVLRPQLQRLRADILCLQEVDSSHAAGDKQRHLNGLSLLLEGTDYQAFHRVASQGRSGNHLADKHNLVILSRYPVLEQRQVRHHFVPPPLHRSVTGDNSLGEAVEWERPAQYLVLELAGGRVLHLINVHLKAPSAAFVAGRKGGGIWQGLGAWAEGFYLSTLKQAGQALEIRLLLEQIFAAEPAALVAVCGDFNAGDHEAPVRMIRGDEEDTGNAHLAGQVLVPVDRSLPSEMRHSAIHHGRPVMLDHILVSRSLLGWYRGCEIHNEELGDELISPLVVPGAAQSFHAPLVAEFVVQRR